MSGRNAGEGEVGESRRRLSCPGLGGVTVERGGTTRRARESRERQSASVSVLEEADGAEREARAFMGSALGVGDGRVPAAQGAPRRRPGVRLCTEDTG